MVNSLAFVIFLKMELWFKKFLKLNPSPLLLLIKTNQELKSRTTIIKIKDGLLVTHTTLDRMYQ